MLAAEFMDRKQTISFLEKDILNNIVPLKMIQQYAGRVRLLAQKIGTDYGIIVEVPRACSNYYSTTYPLAKSVLFPVATNGCLLNPFFEKYRNLALMIAIPSEEIVKIAKAFFKLHYQRTFLSFTCNETISIPNTRDVKISKKFSVATKELFYQNGYSKDELSQFENWGGKTFSILSSDGDTLSACFIFPNYGKVWEIAGVRTKEAERGKGMAKKIVQIAANYIIKHNGLVRYQVECTNNSSVRLASAVGFRKFLELKHFTTT